MCWPKDRKIQEQELKKKTSNFVQQRLPVAQYNSDTIEARINPFGRMKCKAKRKKNTNRVSCIFFSLQHNQF